MKFPIHLDIPVDQTSKNYIARIQSFKQSVETVLGEENVVIDIQQITTDELQNITYYAASAAAEDWDLSGAVGWNPDYEDPSTYLDILKTTNAEQTKTYMGYEGADNAAAAQVGLKEYDKLVDEAGKETSDLNVRYEKYAAAQAWLTDSSLFLPDNSKGTRKVTTRMAVYFYGCITMDGYLADSQHRIDWLHQLGSVEDTGYDDFYRQMDITIMGKRTFEEIQDLQDVESFYQATENYVFTHDRHLPVSNYQPVAGDVVDFVQQIDKGKNVFVIGGNSLVGPLLDADLFDHLIIQIAPLILGKGVPLFTQEEGQRFYQLDSLRQFGPFAELVFRNYSILIPYFLLSILGLIVVYSTTSATLIEEGKSAFQLVRNQGIFWIASLILIALIYKLKLGFLRNGRLIFIVMIVEMVLLALARLVGTPVNGAYGWISVGPVTIQPAEYLKIIIIWYLAHRFSKQQDEIAVYDFQVLTQIG